MCSFHVSSGSISAFPSPREQCSLDTRQALRKCLCNQRPGVSPEGSRPPLLLLRGMWFPKKLSWGAAARGLHLFLVQCVCVMDVFLGAAVRRGSRSSCWGVLQDLVTVTDHRDWGVPSHRMGWGMPSHRKGWGEVHSQRDPRGLSPDES